MAPKSPQQTDTQPTTDWLAGLLLKHNPAWLERYVEYHARLQRLSRQKRRWITRKAAVTVAGAALLLALAQAPAAHAANITVETNIPAINGDSLCSLSEAIINANVTGTYADCDPGSAGSDTITLSGNTYTFYDYYDLPSISGNNALPTITSPIIIEGNGSALVRDSGADHFRILNVDSIGDLTLNNVTISGGYAPDGGGVYSLGTLTLNQSTVTNNRAKGNGSERGGGIAVRNGTATISGSTVSNNYALIAGGGIYNHGTVVITDSVISGNTAKIGDGAGIYTYSGNTEIRTSSIDNNGSVGHRGGIFSGGGTLSIYDSAITRNAGNYGGG
ncbi:MAG: hypothetical protein R3C44_24310 [Chloroflexota bacterium]